LNKWKGAVHYTFLLQANGQTFEYPVDVRGWKMTTRHLTLDKARYAQEDEITAVVEFWNEGEEPITGLRLRKSACRCRRHDSTGAQYGRSGDRRSPGRR
jgi:hypothetical protein